MYELFFVILSAMEDSTPYMLITYTSISEFIKELLVLRKCRHKNIIKILDVNFCDGELRIKVPQYNRSLKQYISNNNTLRFDKTLAITKSMIAGVEHLWGLGFMYNNMSPDSIMMNSVDDVVLANLHSVSLRYDNYNADVPSREFQYMAPELGNGFMIIHNTVASDIWAMGCIVYNMICGDNLIDNNFAMSSTALCVALDELHDVDEHEHAMDVLISWGDQTFDKIIAKLASNHGITMTCAHIYNLLRAAFTIDTNARIQRYADFTKQLFGPSAMCYNDLILYNDIDIFDIDVPTDEIECFGLLRNNIRQRMYRIGRAGITMMCDIYAKCLSAESCKLSKRALLNTSAFIVLCLYLNIYKKGCKYISMYDVLHVIDTVGTEFIKSL